MYLRRLVLLFLCIAPGGLHSQEPVNTGSVQDIYNHLSGVIAKAESVDFHGTHHSTETEIGPLLNPKRAGTEPWTTDVDLRFRGRGTKYSFTEWHSAVADYAPRAATYAWDGKYYQVLTLTGELSGYLYISKNCPLNDHLRMDPSSALKMFGFLVPQSPPGPLSEVGWDLVKNLNAWRVCLAGAHLVGPLVFHGKPCSVVTIPNVLHRRPEVPHCTYTVYFSWNDGMFPMAWKIEDEYHRVLEDYEVVEFGQVPCSEGQVFYYPKKAKGAFYPDGDFPPGKPEATFTSSYDSFKLNTIDDDDAFTIDRATTQQVYNGDTGVCTPTHPPVRAPDGKVIKMP